MTFRAAVKQTFRTPVKSMLFFLLLCLCAGLLVMGINLFASSTQALADISQSYQTVGTLQQMPDSTHTEIIDYFGESTFVDTPEYHTVIPQDALENLPTLLPVENRPLVYSTGVKEDGTSLITGTLMYPSYCVTFSPLEDGDSTDSAFLEAHAQEGTGFVLQVEVYSIQWGVSLEEAVSGLLYWPEDLETYPAHLEKGKSMLPTLVLSPPQTNLRFRCSLFPSIPVETKLLLPWNTRPSWYMRLRSSLTHRRRRQCSRRWRKIKVSCQTIPVAACSFPLCPPTASVC